jgi:hypothetical protein
MRKVSKPSRVAVSAGELSGAQLSSSLAFLHKTTDMLFKVVTKAGDAKLRAGDDVIALARKLGIRVPRELNSVAIEVSPGSRLDEPGIIVVGPEFDPQKHGMRHRGRFMICVRVTLPPPPSGGSVIEICVGCDPVSTPLDPTGDRWCRFYGMWVGP